MVSILLAASAEPPEHMLLPLLFGVFGLGLFTLLLLLGKEHRPVQLSPLRR